MNLLENKRGRALLVFSLYLSEGAPIGFIWWALPTVLRARQVPVESITSLTALLVLPWVFKFLWAPLVDVLRTGRHGFKSWIIFSQLAMGAALVPLMFLSPATHFSYWIVLLLIHSFAAATQDVSIDALVINAVAPAGRGILNGYMQAGMLTGRSVFGGGALLLIPSFGLPGIMILLTCAIFATMILLAFTREQVVVGRRGKRYRELLANLRQSFGEKNTWLVILFALTSSAAFESAGALAGPFLTDLGMSESRIGFFFLLPVVACMLVGGLAGGWLSDRYNRKQAVALFLCGFTICVALIASMKTTGMEATLPFLILFGCMYFFVGMFTSSSYALYMDHTNPRLGATQFSTYMAATNGCESWTVWTAGKITGAWDYPAAFLVMGAVSLLSLVVLAYCKSAGRS